MKKLYHNITKRKYNLNLSDLSHESDSDSDFIVYTIEGSAIIYPMTLLESEDLIVNYLTDYMEDLHQNQLYNSTFPE